MQESARDGMQERFKVVYGTAGRAVPALRRGVEHPVTRAGRRQPDDILVSTMSALRRIGHKGADLIVPGNTPASFDAALAHGVDMIEFDVLPEHRTRAGCCSRTTTSTSTARRRSRKASPTSRAAPFDGVELDVDLKLPGYEERAVDALREHGLVERSLVSTNWMRSLIRSGALEPQLRLGWSRPAPEERPDAALADEASRPTRAPRTCAAKLPSPVAVHMAAGRCDALMAHWRLVSPRLVRAVREAGGELYVWTVDDGPRIGRLERLGVTGVITNDPRLFAQLLERAGRGRVAGRVGARAGAVAGLGGDLGRARQRVAAAPAEPHDAAQRRRPWPACANVKLQPDSTGAPFAAPTRAPAGVGVLDVVPLAVGRRGTGRGSASRAARPCGVPGIDARMPIASGCLAVSQTLTVAHAAPAPCAAARRQQQHGNAKATTSAIAASGERI